MAIATDLDIQISYLLNVIFPGFLIVGAIFGFFSFVSFSFYCYQLIRSCSRRSCCHRGGYTKEDYLYNYDFKSLKGKPSDKAISCENSGGSPGKMDSNLVRKNLKKPKDFFKDSIYSSNEHKSQSTDVKSSPQGNERGHDIVTDQQDRSFSKRSNSFKQAISPEDYPHNNYSKSLEKGTSDMASTSKNLGGSGSMTDSKRVQKNSSDSNDSPKDSIHSPKEYKLQLNDLNKSSQSNRRGQNFVPDQQNKSFPRRFNSIEEGKESVKTSTSENSGGSHGKIDFKQVRENLKKPKNFSKDSIHSSNEHKLQSTNVTTSSQDDRKEQNVASDTEGDISKLDGKNMREASRKLYSRINEKKENQIRESNKIISGSRV